MKLSVEHLTWLSILLNRGVSIVLQPNNSVPIAYPSRSVADFPVGTWAENLAVRSNGQILVNLLNTPQTYQVDPLSLQSPILVNQFPNPDGSDGLLGITEVQQDVFYVVRANFSVATGKAYPGTSSIWQIDMNPFKISENGTIISPAKTQKIVDIPETQLLNGLTTLETAQHTILMADSNLGGVWKLNVSTRQYELIIKDPLMAPASNHIRRRSNRHQRYQVSQQLSLFHQHSSCHVESSPDQ